MIRRLTILLLIIGLMFAQDDVFRLENKNIVCINFDDTTSAAWNHQLSHTKSQTVIIGKKIFEKPVNANFDIGCLGRYGVGCEDNNGSGFYT